MDTGLGDRFGIKKKNLPKRPVIGEWEEKKKTFSNLLIDLNVHVRSPVAFIIATTRESTEFLFRKFEAFSHLHSKFSSTVVLKWGEMHKFYSSI